MKSIQPEIRLNPMESTSVTCDSCGSQLFKQCVLIRRWNKLLIGSQDDVIDFIPAFRCDDCGEVFKQMVPTGLPGLEVFKDNDE